jgi:3-oxoacyl-[acyl-carrier-protein] synthase-3
MAFQLMGTGSALLSRAVTNDELSKFLDTSDEWIRTRTGIEERRVCMTEKPSMSLQWERVRRH